MESILQIDQDLFLLVNGKWTSSFLDMVLVPIRNAYFWAPLYLFIVAYSLLNYKKQGWMIIAMLLLTFAMADFTSSWIIKPLYERARPCNDDVLSEQVRLLVRCGHGFSFTSSHATNHFALAFCLIAAFARQHKWVIPSAILWAASISYAQVYVGVHYPMDVMGGAILGSLIGAFVGKAGMLYLHRRT